MAIGIYWVIRRGIALTWLLWSVAGGLAVLIVVSLVFAVVGALDALWDASLAYNIAYSDASLADRFNAAQKLAATLSLVSLLFVAAWCIGVHHCLTGKTEEDRYKSLLSCALILGPVEVALILLSGFSWSHYFLAMLPVGTLYVGYLVHLGKKQLVSPVFISVLLLFIVVNYYAPTQTYTERSGT